MSTPCFIIIRVSTASQEGGFSLEQQRHDLPALAEKRGFSFTPKDIYDFGVASTSKIDEMSGWQEINTAIESGRYDDGYMIVREIDRAHRNLGFGLHQISMFYDHNISILTPRDEYPARDLGHIILKVVKYFSAEDEKNKRKAEQMRAIQVARDSGTYIFGVGNPPFGTLWDQNRRWLVKDPVSWPLVEYIFSDPRRSSSSIARELRARNICGPKGGKIFDSLINRVRSRLVYTGTMLNSKGKRVTAKNVECDIPIDAWEAAQRALRRRYTVATGKRTPKYLMSGIMRCMECGSAITTHTVTGKRKTPYHGYKCHGKKYGCSSPMTAVYMIDDPVLDFMKQFVLTPETLEVLYRDQDMLHAEAEAVLGDIQMQIAETHAKIKRVYRAIENGVDGMTERYHELKQEKDKLEAKASEIRTAFADLPSKAHALELWEKFDDLNIQRKREVIHTFIESAEYIYTPERDVGVMITLRNIPTALPDSIHFQPRVSNGALEGVQAIHGPHFIHIKGSMTALSRIAARSMDAGGLGPR